MAKGTVNVTGGSANDQKRLEALEQAQKLGKNWTQNDPAASDYIDGRTHWKEDPVTTHTVCFEETEVPFTDGGVSVQLSALPIAYEDIFHVRWDGVDYPNLACKEYPLGGVLVGNLSHFSTGYEDTGEPFALWILRDEGTPMCATYAVPDETGETKHTFSIEFDHTEAVVHKLPAEFIPEPKEFGGASVFRDTVVVYEDDWTGDAAPYTCQKEVEGMLATDVPKIDVFLNNDDTAAEQIKQFGCVDYCAARAGYLELKCYTKKPTDYLVIQIEVVR